MKVFVAGATGVIGRRAVRALVTAGHDVTGVARTPDKAALLFRLGGTPTQVDLFDRGEVLDAVAGHDAVVNLATHIPSTAKAALPRSWKENTRIREEASGVLADAAISAGARCHIQESIAFVYADGGDAWLDEDARRDVPPALASVDTAEAQVHRVTASGVSGILLRFGFHHAADSSLTVDTVRVARRGLLVAPGPAAAYLPSVQVDDAATAVVAALDAPSGVYNVVDDDPLQRWEYAEVLAAALGRASVRLPPAFLAKAGGRRAEPLTRSQRVSNRKLKDATGWTPTYPCMRQAWPAIIRELGAA
jgi:nucleoside-diphosphate-sugar epimerase